MIDSNKIEMIVFDVDGTLAETDDYFVGKFTEIIHKIIPFLNKNKIEQPVRGIIMAGETIIHGFYRLLDMAGFDSLISRLHNRMSVHKNYNYAQVDGMRQTLLTLSTKYKLGILTSGGRKSTIAFIDKYDLGSIISYVVSSEDSIFIKPHPLPLKNLADKAGIKPDHCLMVGDTVFDILCAKRAGAYSGVVATGFDSRWFLNLFHADVMMDSVNDLTRILMSAENQTEKGISVDKPKDLV